MRLRLSLFECFGTVALCKRNKPKQKQVMMCGAFAAGIRRPLQAFPVLINCNQAIKIGVALDVAQTALHSSKASNHRNSENDK